MMKKAIYIVLFIFFSTPSGFSQNEAIKVLAGTTNEPNLEIKELVEFAQKHLDNKEQLARFFYYWISANIKYDEEFFEEVVADSITNDEFIRIQDVNTVYGNRKGVCAGYANLFKWFMIEVDIEVVVISGHIRDERNPYVELKSDDNFRHAWNAIKLNNEWILIDSTWGAIQETETLEFYFDIKPEISIITHFPEDNKWQLLKEPLSLEQFNTSQFVDPVWFIVGFTDAPKLIADEKYYYFTFQDIPDNKWSVGLQFSADNVNFEDINNVKVIEKDDLIYFRFKRAQIPEKTFFKVGLVKFEYVGNEYTKYEYKDIINFKI